MPRSRDPEIRDRILDAAAPLFYERGIQGVGMAELTAAAGCGKNVMYREFETKEELVLGYLRTFAERRAERERRAIGDTDGGEALVALVAELAAACSRPDFRGCPFRNYLREFPGSETAAGEFARGWLRDARRRVRRLVTEAGAEDPQTVADQVWLAMDGLWSSAPYADRRRLGRAAVSLVEQLVA